MCKAKKVTTNKNGEAMVDKLMYEDEEYCIRVLKINFDINRCIKRYEKYGFLRKKIVKYSIKKPKQRKFYGA